jgi:pyridoxamine 5'-phosphate oxidase
MMSGVDLARLRQEYDAAGLEPADLAADPFEQFSAWFGAWAATDPYDANAMVLVTATPDGRPSARNVLLKGLDARGFSFFTNLESRKAAELAANPRATLLFSWIAVRRQVIVEGEVERVDDAEADAYFATRPRGAQLGAWASRQSRELADRAELEAAVAQVAARFEGQEVPRPSHWGGYRVVPDRLELWQGRENRLHDRLVYERTADGDGWTITRLSP